MTDAEREALIDAGKAECAAILEILEGEKFAHSLVTSTIRVLIAGGWRPPGQRTEDSNG